MRNLYIFDCFGVVLSEVSALWMEKHFNKIQQQQIRQEVFRKVDCGVFPFDKSFEILGVMCGISAQQARKEWDECMFLNRETIDVIDALRNKGQVTALLSNASRQYVNSLFDQFNLWDKFDKIFVSQDYGVAKPDRRFYEICLENFDEKFGKIYFIDDNEVNLIEPEKLGVIPILFTSANQLKRQLLL